MSSPKIGKAFEKAGNALAFQARKLHEQARTVEQESEENTLNRLRRLGDDAEAEERTRFRAEADNEVKVLFPLIDEVTMLTEEAEEARTEAQPVLDSINEVNWPAVTRKLSDTHGFTRGSSPIIPGEEGVEDSDVIVNRGAQFSTDSTKHRISRLRRAAEELAVLVSQSSDSETRARLRDAESLVDEFRMGVSPRRSSDPEWRHDRTYRLRYAVNSLRQAISYGSLAEGIRGRLAGVKKLLAEIGTDVVALGGEEVR